MNRLALLFALIPVLGMGPVEISRGEGASPDKLVNAPAKSIQKWREMRFGLFVHWGPVSLKGTEIGWSRAGERPGIVVHEARKSRLTSTTTCTRNSTRSSSMPTSGCRSPKMRA